MNDVIPRIMSTVLLSPQKGGTKENKKALLLVKA